MSTESHLPSELAQLEKHLRAASLPASAVNRDELMFQAGWAAAEGARKGGWLWLGTAGVLAASVAVLAFSLVKTNDATSVAEVDAVVEALTVEVVTAPESPAEQVVQISAAHWSQLERALALRHRMVDRRFRVPRVEDLEDDFVRPVRTTRELLREMLTETGFSGRDGMLDSRPAGEDSLDGREIL